MTPVGTVGRPHPPEVLAELVDLLAGSAALAGHPRADLAALAARGEVAHLAAAEPPLTPALVVMRGEVMLRDPDGAVADLAEAGSYAAPAVTQTVGPAESGGSALVLWLPEETRRLAWTAGPGPGWHAVRDPGTTALHGTPVRAVMSSPVVTAEPAESCRAAAERMAEHGVSCVLVPDGDRLGVLTDRDLRTRLVARGRSAETPVAEVATWPAHGIGPGLTCFEALVEMLDRGVRHLPVLEGGRPVGVLTGTDLHHLEARGPWRVRRRLDRAPDVAGVASALRSLPDTAAALLASGVAPAEIGRVVATLTDHVQRRVHDLVADDPGTPPRPPGRASWLCFGSQARGEQTLRTDQDTGLVLPAGAAAEERSAWAAYAAAVADALEGCGYPRCHGGVTAGLPDWTHDAAGWRHRLRRLVVEPSEPHLLVGSIAFDLRVVSGEHRAEDLATPALAAARGHVSFQAHLARTAVSHRPPLGFRGRFVVARSGEHAGELDLKAGALLPIADLARLWTLVRGGTETGTGARLAAAAHDGVLSGGLAETLRGGYDLALGLRLRSQVGAIDAGREPGHHVDPRDLDAGERALLRETFRAVRLAQEHLATRFQVGLLG